MKCWNKCDPGKAMLLVFRTTPHNSLGSYPLGSCWWRCILLLALYIHDTKLPEEVMIFTIRIPSERYNLEICLSLLSDPRSTYNCHRQAIVYLCTCAVYPTNNPSLFLVPWFLVLGSWFLVLGSWFGPRQLQHH